ncbi:hypothetical protein ACFPVX_04800 [Cohnella faecalis]|nr:hypothetical protein [Cohnella faecalis]
MSITVTWSDGHVELTTPEQMALLAGRTFAVADRVPGIAGEAFDFGEWYSAAVVKRSRADGREPATLTHLSVRAADEFEAVIPLEQLGAALFQYRIDGLPLDKGKPIRLYVPDGSSACLNVKSVVTIGLVSDPTLGEEAAYGFRNEITPAGMMELRKSRD